MDNICILILFFIEIIFIFKFFKVFLMNCYWTDLLDPVTGSNQMDWNDTRDLSVLNPSLIYLK